MLTRAESLKNGSWRLCLAFNRAKSASWPRSVAKKPAQFRLAIYSNASSSLWRILASMKSIVHLNLLGRKNAKDLTSVTSTCTWNSRNSLNNNTAKDKFHISRLFSISSIVEITEHLQNVSYLNFLTLYLRVEFMHSDILVDAILDFRGDVQNEMYDFLNYICLGRNTDIISQIHFVRALQVLSPDDAARAASPEMIGRGSADRLPGIGDFYPTTLNEMLLKIPERPSSQKIDPLMQKLADHLQATGEIGKLEKSFPLAKKILIKTSLGLAREVSCAKKTELEAFLRA